MNETQQKAFRSSLWLDIMFGCIALVVVAGIVYTNYFGPSECTAGFLGDLDTLSCKIGPAVIGGILAFGVTFLLLYALTKLQVIRTPTMYVIVVITSLAFLSVVAWVSSSNRSHALAKQEEMVHQANLQRVQEERQQQQRALQLTDIQDCGQFLDRLPVSSNPWTICISRLVTNPSARSTCYSLSRDNNEQAQCDYALVENSLDRRWCPVQSSPQCDRTINDALSTKINDCYDLKGEEALTSCLEGLFATINTSGDQALKNNFCQRFSFTEGGYYVAVKKFWEASCGND